MKLLRNILAIVLLAATATAYAGYKISVTLEALPTGGMSTRYPTLAAYEAAFAGISWTQAQPPITSVTVNTSFTFDLSTVLDDGTCGSAPTITVTTGYSLGTGWALNAGVLEQTGSTPANGTVKFTATCSSPAVAVDSPEWLYSSIAAVAGDTTAPPAPQNCTLSATTVTCGPVSDPSGIANYKLYTYVNPTYTLRDTQSATIGAVPALTEYTIGSFTSGSSSASGDGATFTSVVNGDMGYTRTADSILARCTPVAGSPTISARLTDFNKLTANYPKASVFLTADPTVAGSPMIALTLYPEGTNALATEYRTTLNAAGLQAGVTTGTAVPYTVQITYNAATDVATTSYDLGAGQVVNATVTVAMPDVMYACVGMSSRNESLSATFDEISITSQVIPTFDLSGVAACDSGCTIAVTATDGATNESVKSTHLVYTVGDGTPAGGTRSKLLWPYADNSIWNRPIGSGAIYTDANVTNNPTSSEGSDAVGWGFAPNSNPVAISMNSAASTRNIKVSTAGWSGASRCTLTSPDTNIHTGIPYTSSLVVPSDGKDYAGVFIKADGDTIVQTAPTACCSGVAYCTAYNLNASGWTQSLIADGRTGSQGGSYLSALGGVLRLNGSTTSGDLIDAAPKHALKINLMESQLSDCDDTSAGCGRWPAYHGETTGYGDGDTEDPVGSQLLMGALLAIKPDVDCENIGLETQPGKWLCWTLQNYGAYVVDSNPGSTIMLSTELSTTGDYTSAFQTQWGVPFGSRIRNHSTNAWARDFSALTPLLHVISNNSSTSVGGGGTPRQPLAPAFE